jgi:protein-disulfide isomerase
VTKSNRLGLLAVLAVLISMIAPGAQAEDASVLKPPKGARVAIVVFEDLQCPECARTHPLLEEAARTYKIPLLRYDFPLPLHSWSQQAAVLARYFDGFKAKPTVVASKLKTPAATLGDEFRDEVFKHQQEITKENLREFAEKFASAHGVVVPFIVDPQGKLAAEVARDHDLGERIHIVHTPTIYVVSNSLSREVQKRDDLFETIDAMQKDAR